MMKETAIIRARSLTFLRFSNDDVRLISEEPIQQIEAYLKEKLGISKD